MTSQLEISYDVTFQKTDAQALRIERFLRGGRLLPDDPAVGREPVRMDEAKEGEHTSRVEAMSEPFMWDLGVDERMLLLGAV